MQKLKLGELHQYSTEVLTKEQMKKVLGGLLSGGDNCSGSCDYQWTDSKGKEHTTTGSCLKTGPKNELCYCSNVVGSCSKPA